MRLPDTRHHKHAFGNGDPPSTPSHYIPLVFDARGDEEITRAPALD
jgi:hypothetical protein